MYSIVSNFVTMKFMTNNIKQGDKELPLTHTGHDFGIVYRYSTDRGGIQLFCVSGYELHELCSLNNKVGGLFVMGLISGQLYSTTLDLNS